MSQACPQCNCKKSAIRRSSGYTNLIIKECDMCECVFMIDEYKNTKVLFKGK